MKPFIASLTLVCALLIVSGCDRTEIMPTEATHDPVATPNILSKKAGSSANLDPAAARIVAMVDEINEKFSAAGSELRLEYPWMFQVGAGVDPFGSLRTGARWMKADVEYVFDRRDFTTQIGESELEAVMVQSFQSWNDIRRTYLNLQRGPDVPDDPLENPDFLDGTFVPGPDGNPVCATFIDVFSPTLIDVTPTGGLIIDPITDILVGGWLDPAYFELCLGSPSILGVTWSLSGGDSNGDGYRDLVYVEQFYNEGFNWVTSGSQFLDFSPNAGIDVESVVVHENGHAVGLGHFGGPVRNQPFKLRGNNKVFTPEAVMNGGYLGGEKRTPLPTDVAGLTTLYSGHMSTTIF